jgi:hypothetical protein
MSEDRFELVTDELNVVRYKLVQSGKIRFRVMELEAFLEMSQRSFIDFVASNRGLTFREDE